MTVLCIQNIYLATAQAGRDAEFYTKALGAEVRFADGEHWVQMSAGGSGLALAGPRESAVECGAVIVFEVNDIAAAEQAVEAAGGKLLAARDMGAHGRTRTFADPSGNVSQLFQRAAG